MGCGQKKSKGANKGHRAKKKMYKKSHCTANRSMDVDQIQDMLEKEVEKNVKTSFENDDDLPGNGQFYCTPCARHFVDNSTLEIHVKSKLHKRRIKDVNQVKYTQAEAEAGAGKTREVYAPAHPGLSRAMLVM